MSDNVKDKADRTQKMLFSLFDLQRFAPNSRLERLVAEAEERGRVISDEELELVNAAGVSRPYPLPHPHSLEGQDGGNEP